MRQDAIENQQEILKCAKQLFAEKGVQAVSMNLIAKTLGIGAGTLYRHYANKSMLCMALVYDDLAQFIETSQQYLAQDHHTPRHHFEQILTWYLEFREANKALLMDVDAGNVAASGSYFYTSESYQAVVGVFAEVLADNSPELSQQACQFRADMLIAMLKSDAYAYQRHTRQLDQQQLVTAITALFLEAS